METRDFQKVLNKIDEINALFIFAQRVIPYLEELIIFVQETTPLLEEVNTSILESSNKMPAAVQQLDKVSATTEMATSDILDGLDRILEHIEKSINILNKASSEETEKLNMEKELILKIAETLDGEAETRAAKVEAALIEYNQERQEKSELKNLQDLLTLIQSETYNIMTLLQVQDITTQQIMAANTLIESVQFRLNDLITKFGSIESQPDSQKKRFFDPNATFEKRTDAQDLADQIIAENHASSSNEQMVKTVEIDKSDKIIKQLVDKEAEKASQEEIDRLFNELKK